MQQLIKAFDRPGCPALLNTLLQRAARLLEHEAIQSLAKTERGLKFNPVQVIYYGWHIRERFKNQALELIEIYGSLDAWYSMAMATVNTNSASPNSCNRKIPASRSASFIIFTAGARVLRCATEPPDELSLSLPAPIWRARAHSSGLWERRYPGPPGDGRASLRDAAEPLRRDPQQYQCHGHISRGESYFFNEVQRIRDTLIKISGSRKWLVLIDELFKGTNMQDAMNAHRR